MNRFLLLLLLVASAPLAWAQDSSPRGFQLGAISVSPYEVGTGGAASFSPTDNPFAVGFNPALLADAGRRPGLRIGASLTPEAFGNADRLIGASALSIGFRSEVAGRPLHVGLGGSYTEFNIDNVTAFDEGGVDLGRYDTEERAYGGGLGIGWQGPVHVRVGAAATRREGPEESLFDINGPSTPRDRVVTLDVGGALTYPLLAGPTESGEQGPVASVTAGYVQRGIALAEDFYERSELTGSDLLRAPEVGVAGASVDVALVRRFGARGRFRVAEASLRGQTESGDAGLWRVGAEVRLFETVMLRAGRDELEVTSIGAGVSLDGLIRAAGAATESPRRLAFGDRLTARADVGIYDVGGSVESTTVGFTLGWRP